MSNEELIIGFLKLLKSPKLCFGILVTSSVMIYFRHDLHLPNKIFWVFVVFFLMSLTLLIYDALSLLLSKNKRSKEIQQLKKNFLYKIYTSMQSGYKNPEHKYAEEVVLINILYLNNLKRFTINDIKTIQIYKDLDKNKLISSLNFLGDSGKESLIFMKDGKYEFYDNVWHELDTFSKTGLLPFKKCQELPKDKQDLLKINQEK